ncbi:MAG: hypothetical protein AB1779_08730 [Candidatus Thermoplasmatota archaeon]
MEIKIPISYIFIIFCIVAIALFISLSWIGIIPYENIFFFITTVIIGWVAFIIIAIIGGFLTGMFLSHRILSIGAFTPFEEEMLKMREDIKEIKEEIKKISKKN